LVSNEPLPLPELYANHKRKKSSSRLDEMIESGSININPKAGNVNSQVLAQAWDTTKCFTKSDWFEWIRKLSITLLAESPSAALRCMAPLAMSHQPVARQLFNAGFVSCWGQLSAELRDNLVKCIEQALSSANIPPEILQILLDLAEFMEHNEKALPIDIKILASLAVKCQAYAKALHYKVRLGIFERFILTFSTGIGVQTKPPEHHRAANLH
jgi:FKBP12-rapamycin complex-associated protein